jgi:hypothetical protein
MPDFISREVIAYADYHDRKGTWHGKSTWFWYWSLVEEVIELGLSLLRLHEGPARHELKQVGSCAINFMRELNRQRKLR